MASNSESSVHRGSEDQPSPGNQTKDVNKPGPLATQVSGLPSLSHPSNRTSAVNISGIMSNPVAKSSQADHKKQTTAVNKQYLESDTNKVIKLNESNMFEVRMACDSGKCYINGICETATGILIIDWSNKKMKLLDQDYKVVAHYDLPGKPSSMCSINSRLVAVAVDVDVYISEIHFIRATNSQLLKHRTIKLQCSCKCIAHHQGNLYIFEGTRSLLRLTLDGRYLGRIYQDLERYRSARPEILAISPDGDRIYVANGWYTQLLTLSGDGTLISTLADPLVQCLSCVHVTDSGQVLVCGGSNNRVIQVDRDGRQVLAELVTGKDEVDRPVSIYVSKHTGTLVVGMEDGNIRVYTQGL